MTFTPYSNTGPFTNNVVPICISATFLNNIENFLDQIDSSAVSDLNVTANGSGALTAVNAPLPLAVTLLSATALLSIWSKKFSMLLRKVALMQIGTTLLVNGPVFEYGVNVMVSSYPGARVVDGAGVVDGASGTLSDTPKLIELAMVVGLLKRLPKNSTQVVSYGPTTALTVFHILKLSAWSDVFTSSTSICVPTKPSGAYVTVSSCPAAYPLSRVANWKRSPCSPYCVNCWLTFAWPSAFVAMVLSSSIASFLPDVPSRAACSAICAVFLSEKTDGNCPM